MVPRESMIRFAGAIIGAEERANLLRVVESGKFTAGAFCDAFEAKLARWYEVKAARVVNSGSSANLLAVAALMSPLLGEEALRPGDEVITLACGFPTTVAPIVQLGLVPVFVDVEPPNYNVRVADLENVVSPRTRAVMLAHTLGLPFDVDAVLAFCRKHGLFLVEDNCDAAGAKWQGEKTGSFGHLATLSFYPAHQMTTGEGGAVLIGYTSYAQKLIRAVQSLRDWGRDCWCAPNKDNTCGQRFSQVHGTLPKGYDHKYVYSHLGFNLKMTEFQAAIGVAQVDRLDDFCHARRENWQTLWDELEGLVVTHVPQSHTMHSPFGFLMSSPHRDEIVRRLEEAKIQTRPLFAGNLLLHPAMSGRTFRALSLSGTNRAAREAFWIGVWPGLAQDDLLYMIDTLRTILGEKR